MRDVGVRERPKGGCNWRDAFPGVPRAHLHHQFGVGVPGLRNSAYTGRISRRAKGAPGVMSLKESPCRRPGQG